MKSLNVKTVKGNIWKIPCHWICVPTQGSKIPDIEVVRKIWNAQFILEANIERWGEKVYPLGLFTRYSYIPQVDKTKQYQFDFAVVQVFSFPQDVESSCEQMAANYRGRVIEHDMEPEGYARQQIPKVVVPKVGNWETSKPIYEKYFLQEDWIICDQTSP